MTTIQDKQRAAGLDSRIHRTADLWRRLTEAVDAEDKFMQMTNEELSALLCEHVMDEMSVLSIRYTLCSVIRNRLEVEPKKDVRLGDIQVGSTHCGQPYPGGNEEDIVCDQRLGHSGPCSGDDGSRRVGWGPEAVQRRDRGPLRR